MDILSVVLYAYMYGKIGVFNADLPIGATKSSNSILNSQPIIPCLELS